MRFVIAIAALLLPTAGFAIELDFYTYNGFDETVAAFQRLGLLVSDNTFLFLVGVFVAIGLTFGMVKMGADGMSGGQINPMAVLVPTIFGIALFKAVVIPTGTLHVYDPVRNAYQPVAGVPDIVVVGAGLLSKIERAIIAITDTASANPYADMQGAINYSLIKNVMSADLNDVYLERSLREYYTYCGMRALGQNTAGSWWQQLLHGSDDLAVDFGRWTNNVLTVIYYPPGNDAGVTLTCKDAWDQLSPRLADSSTYDAYVRSVCRTSGFNVGDAAQLGRCSALLSDTSSMFDIATPGAIPYLRSVVLSKSIAEATNTADFSQGQRAMVDRQVMAEGFGSAHAMNSWVPRLRAFMLAAVVGLMPIAFLFLVTPLVKPALALILGLFSWLALWGACDVIAVQMAYDMAADAFDQIREQRLGVDAILNSPEASIQALGIFGKARLVALTLATVLSSALFKFGGYAFAQLGQQWQGHFEQAGEAAGRNTLLPEATAGFQRSLQQATAPFASNAAYGFTATQMGYAGNDMQVGAMGRGYVDDMISGRINPQNSLGAIMATNAAASVGAMRGTAEGWSRVGQETGASVSNASAGSSQFSTERKVTEDLTTSATNHAMHGDQGDMVAGAAAGAMNASRTEGDRQRYEDLTGVHAHPNAVDGDALKRIATNEVAGQMERTSRLDAQSARTIEGNRSAEDIARLSALNEDQYAEAGRGSAYSGYASGSAMAAFVDNFGLKTAVQSYMAKDMDFAANARALEALTVSMHGDNAIIHMMETATARATAAQSVFVSPDHAQDFLANPNFKPGFADQMIAQGALENGFVVRSGLDVNAPENFGVVAASLDSRATAFTGSARSHEDVATQTYGTTLTTGSRVNIDSKTLSNADGWESLIPIFADGASAQDRIAVAEAYGGVVRSNAISAGVSDTDLTQFGVDGSGTIRGNGQVGIGGGSGGRNAAASVGGEIAGRGTASFNHSDQERIDVDGIQDRMLSAYDAASATADKAVERQFGTRDEWNAATAPAAAAVHAQAFHVSMSGEVQQVIREGRAENSRNLEDLNDKLETTGLEKLGRDPSETVREFFGGEASDR